MATIVLIENDPASCKLVTLVARQAGHHVVAHSDARAAAGLARRHRAALVFMGCETRTEPLADAAREIRCDSFTARVGLYALVPRAMLAQRARLTVAGFDAVLGKPADYREVYRHLSAGMRARR